MSEIKYGIVKKIGVLSTSVRSRRPVNLPDLQPSGRRSGRTKYLLAFSDFGILLFGTR